MSDRFDINHVYNILGLKPGASVDELKQAYRQMAKTWHPDCFLEPHQKLEAEEKIKEINQAYGRLKSYQPSETNQSASTSTNIDFTPSNAESFYKLGLDKAQRGKYTEAIEDFTQAIRLNPNYFEAYKYRGLAYSKLGYENRAESDFKNSIQLELKQKKADLVERDNNNASGGLLLGIIITSLVGLVIGGVWYFSQNNNAPVNNIVPVVVPVPSKSSPTPSASPQPQTTIIERTREIPVVVPVP